MPIDPFVSVPTIAQDGRAQEPSPAGTRRPIGNERDKTTGAWGLNGPPNQYGVRVSRLAKTETKTYHGLSIIFNGSTVGRIRSWTPVMFSRDGTHVMEVGRKSWGRPVDYTPGPGRNFSISCSRTEVWNNEMERMLGNSLWEDLMDQKVPFYIYEALFRGEQVYTLRVYHNCWFSEKNYEPFEAEGQAKVVINATINFVSRLRVV